MIEVIDFDGLVEFIRLINFVFVKSCLRLWDIFPTHGGWPFLQTRILVIQLVHLAHISLSMLAGLIYRFGMDRVKSFGSELEVHNLFS